MLFDSKRYMFKEIFPKIEKVEENPLDEVKMTIEISEGNKKLQEEFEASEGEVIREAIVEEKKPPRTAKLKKALQSITAGLFLMVAVNAYAQEYPRLEEKVPKEKIIEMAKQELSAQEQNKLALQTLEKLVQIPDQPRAKSEAQNQYLQRRVAKILIHCLAGQLKTGKIDFGVKISPQDLKRTLDLLNENISAFADQKFGNKDGETTPEEFREFQKATKKYPGLQVLQQMIIQYSYLE